jgi:predicted metalloprotease
MRKKVGEKRNKLKACIPRDMYLPLVVSLMANGAGDCRKLRLG